MRSASRPVKNGDPPGRFLRRGNLPPAENHRRTATTLAGVDFASELLSRRTVSPEFARQALDQLRRRTLAQEVVFWTVAGTTATCAIRAGAAEHDAPLPAVELAQRGIVMERLRRHGALLCRAGDLSGVEELVPLGVQSSAVVTVPNGDDLTGVLIVGWNKLEPPCDRDGVAQFRIAAAVLLRTLAPPRERRATLGDAIVGSLTERVVVIDGDGLIVTVNAAWTASPLPLPMFEAAGPGANYLALCRRAAVEGHREFAAIDAGTRAVARGQALRYQATLALPLAGEDESFLVTATPLRHRAGGAVISHANVVQPQTGELALRIGEQHFHRLMDAIPIPIWLHDGEGRVLHGNGNWKKIAGALPETDGRWTAVLHPDDRARAVIAFPPALPLTQVGPIDVRVLSPDGTYRWSVCSCAPFTGVDGRLEAAIGCYCDVGMQRHAELALAGFSARLVAAQEQERSRVGRELHDDLGQRTASLATRIEMLLRTPRLSGARLRAGVVDAKREVQDLAVAIHHLSHQLHSPRLKLLGLVKTLEGLCRDVATESGLNVTFRADTVPADVPEHVALCAWRVAQEALQNAVKHSGAKTMYVALTGAPSQLTLCVTDTGRGFDPLTSRDTGIGLLSMRERVELTGGRLLIHSGSGGGTTIEAVMPLAAQPAANGKELG